MNLINPLKILRERGFIKQCTDEEGASREFENRPATVYAGFDPTADSLHVGHLLPLMALAHIQRCGHRPVAILGGGTAMVGDPSGRSEMRQMLSRDNIVQNGNRIKNQMACHLDLSSPDKGMVIDNAQWLLPLNYIDFLRDIGRHFSVNRMLTFEAYRMRMETGLSFIEFNYQLLQSYDFLELYRRHDCRFQLGGDDQWGNIVAGIDLIRRCESVECYGITFPLLTTASGEKMGKTAKGALWLSADRLAPYEYFQYWVNVDDRDVIKLLSLFTFLPLEEIKVASKLTGRDLNYAKRVLAWEATALNHGRNHADDALSAASAAFGASDIPPDLLPSSRIPRTAFVSEKAVPSSNIDSKRLQSSPGIIDMFVETGLCSSRSEARRFMSQGGIYLNDERVDDPKRTLKEKDFEGDAATLKLGKKRYHRLVLT